MAGVRPERPVAYALLEVSRRLADVVHIPRVGYVISDAELRHELLAGQRVDLVVFMKHFASRMACEMIGVRVDPDAEQAVYTDMFALATEFTALAGLGKRRLSEHDVEKGKQIIERLSAYIRGSYDDADVTPGV